MKLPAQRAILLDAVTLIPTGYTGSTAELLLSSVIDEVVVFQDGQQKVRIKPSLQRKLDEFYNSNGETLDISKATVPFNRFTNPNSGWGVGNIRELLLVVKFAAAFAGTTAISALEGHLRYHKISAPVSRGNIFVQNFFPQAAPVAASGGAWNEIQDVPFYGVKNFTKLLLDAANITEVEVWLDDAELVFQKTKEQALYDLRNNPFYRVPSTCTHARVQGQTVTSTGPFPVIFDDFGLTGDSLDVVTANDVRRRIKIKYKVDSDVSAAAAFDLLVEGIEEELQVQGGTTAGRA